MIVCSRLDALQREARERVTALAAPYPAFTLFLSVSDRTSRAQVVQGSGEDFDSAWLELQGAAGHLIETIQSPGTWLRLDWPEQVEMISWSGFIDRLRRIKRNYFRQGISFDADLRLAFLEQELNGNAMLYGGNQISHSIWNRANSEIYSRKRHAVSLPAEPSGDMPIHLMMTTGLFCGEDGTVISLTPAGLDGGRRVVTSLDRDTISKLVADGSNFLARQVRSNGRFVYGYHPCFDRQIATYNTLRHTSTTYAMIEA